MTFVISKTSWVQGLRANTLTYRLPVRGGIYEYNQTNYMACQYVNIDNQAVSISSEIPRVGGMSVPCMFLSSRKE